MAQDGKALALQVLGPEIVSPEAKQKCQAGWFRLVLPEVMMRWTQENP